MPRCRPRPRKMVFESLVVDVLNRFLGDYVVNLDKSQLSLGIWKGNGGLGPSVAGDGGAASRGFGPWPARRRHLQLPASPLKLCKAGRRFPGGRRELKPPVPVGSGAGDLWPLPGEGAIPVSFPLGCNEGSTEPTACRTPPRT